MMALSAPLDRARRPGQWRRVGTGYQSGRVLTTGQWAIGAVTFRPRVCENVPYPRRAIGAANPSRTVGAHLPDNDSNYQLGHLPL